MIETWYWRAAGAQQSMVLGTGTSSTRQGVVAQVAALLLHSPHVMAGADGRGIEIVIQPPADGAGL